MYKLHSIKVKNSLFLYESSYLSRHYWNFAVNKKNIISFCIQIYVRSLNSVDISQLCTKKKKKMHGKYYKTSYKAWVETIRLNLCVHGTYLYFEFNKWQNIWKRYITLCLTNRNNDSMHSLTLMLCNLFLFN